MAKGRHLATALLVSDDPAAREATAGVLEGAGYAVIGVGLQEARACALARPVDAIILDLPDPAIADEVARQLKAECIAPLVPILQFMPAGHVAPPLAQSLEASADTFLARPVSPGVLRATVSTLVRLGRAYRELHQERTGLREVLTQMPSGVVVADAEGQLQLTNERAREILCLPEIPGPQQERIGTLQPASRGARATIEGWPLWRALHTGEQVIGEEFDITCGDGRVITARVSAGPIRSPEGEIIAGVLTFTDITERKRAEEERERQRRLLDTLTESSEVWLAYLDDELRFVWANSAYTQATGVDREGMVGRSFAEVFPGSGDLQRWLERARDAGEPVRLHAIRHRLEHRPKPGQRYLDLALRPVKDGAGTLQGIVLSAVDVTLQVRARARLLAAQKARADLAETLRAEVNHRVKNNLAMAAGILQMQSLEEQDERMASRLTEAASRLTTFATIHEELQVTSEDRVELLAALRRLTQATSELLRARGIEFAVEGEPVELPSRSATNMLVVANELITNAAKYCAPIDGGSCAVRLGVQVRLGVHKGKLVLSVWNSGNPVPKDFDASRAAGMGLRLVHALIVDQYRGTVSLRPLEGGTLAEVAVDMDQLGAQYETS